MKYLLFTSILFLFSACTKDKIDTFDFLSCNDIGDTYKAYEEEEIYCKFYYTLTEFEGEEFIELNARCADLTRAFVINNNCEDICDNELNNEDSDCERYLAGRKVIKILLIEK